MQTIGYLSSLVCINIDMIRMDDFISHVYNKNPMPGKALRDQKLGKYKLHFFFLRWGLGGDKY